MQNPNSRVLSGGHPRLGFPICRNSHVISSNHLRSFGNGASEGVDACWLAFFSQATDGVQLRLKVLGSGPPGVGAAQGGS